MSEACALSTESPTGGAHAYSAAYQKKTTNPRDTCGISRKRLWLKVAKASEPEEVDFTGELGVVSRAPINIKSISTHSTCWWGRGCPSFSKPTLQLICIVVKGAWFFAILASHSVKACVLPRRPLRRPGPSATMNLERVSNEEKLNLCRKYYLGKGQSPRVPEEDRERD